MNAVENAVTTAKEKSGLRIGAIASAVGVSRVTLLTWRKQGYVPEGFVLKFAEVTGAAPWSVSRLTHDLKNQMQ